jgi:hypothetical protein
MEITCSRDHSNAKAVRWGEQVGRTAPVPGCPTSRRAGMDGLLHVAAYHRLRPCSCCDDARPTAPPVPPIITGCCPRALAAGWAWRCTQRQDCRSRAVQRCRGVGRCVGGRTPSSHSQGPGAARARRPRGAAACDAARLMIPVQLFSSSDDWPYMLARNSYWILGSYSVRSAVFITRRLSAAAAYSYRS